MGCSSLLQISASSESAGGTGYVDPICQPYSRRGKRDFASRNISDNTAIQGNECMVCCYYSKEPAFLEH